MTNVEVYNYRQPPTSFKFMSATATVNKAAVSVVPKLCVCPVGDRRFSSSQSVLSLAGHISGPQSW